MSVFNYFLGWNGRIGRLQWWLGGLVQGAIIGMGIIVFAARPEASSASWVILGALFVLIALWFGICLTIKRLHDHDKSGFWIFVYLIPIAGAIWQLVECGLMRGTVGNNDYGPDPRFRFDISEDIEALVAERDRQTRATPVRTVTPRAPIAISPTLAPNAAGRPVFGKRV
jgi:uncharacterized membrane protein YhaH (DUF805 family)